MSHAGMVPVFADATEIEPGRYQCNHGALDGGRLGRARFI